MEYHNISSSQKFDQIECQTQEMESRIKGSKHNQFTTNTTSHRATLRSRLNKVKEELRYERAVRQFLERCLSELASGRHVVADDVDDEEEEEEEEEEGAHTSLDMQVRNLKLRLFQERAARYRDSVQCEKMRLKASSQVAGAVASSFSATESKPSGSIKAPFLANLNPLDLIFAKEAGRIRTRMTNAKSSGPNGKDWIGNKTHGANCRSLIRRDPINVAKDLLAALSHWKVAFESSKDEVIRALRQALEVDFEKEKDLMKQLNILRTEISIISSGERIPASDEDGSSNRAFERKIEEFQSQVERIAEKIREARNDSNMIQIIVWYIGGLYPDRDYQRCVQVSDEDSDGIACDHSTHEISCPWNGARTVSTEERVLGQLPTVQEPDSHLDSATYAELGFHRPEIDFQVCANEHGIAQPVQCAGPFKGVEHSDMQQLNMANDLDCEVLYESVQKESAESGPMRKRSKRTE